MCDLKPGDEVVFVGGKGLEPAAFQLKQQWATGLLEDGRVYTVHSVLHEPRWGAIFGVHLMEVICPNRFGFDHRMFRKVQRRDLSAWLETAATHTDHLDKPIKTPARPKIDALLKRVQSGAFG